MENQARQSLVTELVALLTQGNAHATFEDACAGLTPEQWNQHAPNVPYTIWHMVEHIRIAQWDILEFCLDPSHESPEWPVGYWPAPDATADVATWEATRTQIRQDQQRFIELLQNPATDLFTSLPHGTGQNILREALLIGDHAAYHTGEIIVLRRLLHCPLSK